MTGLRASPMRRRVCVSCQTKFIPKRLDAETCSNRCRQAEYQRREARAKAESLFKTQQQIAQNTFDQAQQLESYQSWASLRNADVEGQGLRHVRFMGTRRGLLAVEGLSNHEWSCPQPHPWVRIFEHDPSNPEAGDPEVIEAVVEALQHETLGGSFRQRDYEKEFRALLKRPVRRIALFTDNPNWLDNVAPHRREILDVIPYTATASWAESPEWPEGWEVGNGPHDHGPAVDGRDLDLVFGGGGFTIFNGSKGHP